MHHVAALCRKDQSSRMNGLNVPLKPIYASEQFNNPLARVDSREHDGEVENSHCLSREPNSNMTHRPIFGRVSSRVGRELLLISQPANP